MKIFTKNGVETIYKQKISDGKFSDYAVNLFGFPNDSIYDKEDNKERDTVVLEKTK